MVTFPWSTDRVTVVVDEDNTQSMRSKLLGGGDNDDEGYDDDCDKGWEGECERVSECLTYNTKGCGRKITNRLTCACHT